LVSATGGGFEHQRCGELEPGHIGQRQVSNVTVTVTVPASGTLTNVAAVSSPTGDPNSTNNVSAPVITTGKTPVADVSLGKTGPGSVFGIEQSGLHDFGDELRTVECGSCGGDGHSAVGRELS